MAHQGLNDLQNRADRLLNRYSSAKTLVAEGELIERASEVTADLSRISLTMVTTLPAHVKEIDEASCNNTNATARISRDIVALERRFNEWIQSMRNLRPGSVDEILIQQWHQRARLIRQEISRMDLQPTVEWTGELLAAAKQLQEKMALILKRASDADYSKKINRLEYYQRLQNSHLNSQLDQLYHMGNETQRELVKLFEISCY